MSKNGFMLCHSDVLIPQDETPAKELAEDGSREGKELRPDLQEKLSER